MNARASREVAYDSPLRRQQSDRTRELILDAFADQLADSGLQDFSVAKMAERAGVSVRTVYHHFPDRDALLDALDRRIDRELGDVPFPATAADIAGTVETLFRAFDANEQLVRAKFASELGRSMRQRGRARRLEALRRIVDTITTNLPPQEARQATAVLHHLLNSEAWRSMKDEAGLDGEESGRAVGWAIRTLVAYLERRNRKGEQ